MLCWDLGGGFNLMSSKHKHCLFIICLLYILFLHINQTIALINLRVETQNNDTISYIMLLLFLLGQQMICN